MKIRDDSKAEKQSGNSIRRNLSLMVRLQLQQQAPHTACSSISDTKYPPCQDHTLRPDRHLLHLLTTLDHLQALPPWTTSRSSSLPETAWNAGLRGLCPASYQAHHPVDPWLSSWPTPGASLALLLGTPTMATSPAPPGTSLHPVLA